MTQIPNTYDASAGHKLQDMSKDAIIETSWPTGFKNKEYEVLSCVNTLSCWAKRCCLSRDVKSAWHHIGVQGVHLSCLNSGIME
jgi:hypothetical protein